MDIAGLIVGAFVGGIGGFVAAAVLAASGRASLEEEYQNRIDRLKAQHEEELKNIRRMGKRRGAIAGADA